MNSNICVYLAMLERYLQRQQTESAVLIQKTWRGHHARKGIRSREIFVKRYRAAVIVQRSVSFIIY